MDIKDRFFASFDYLKKEGKIQSYTQLAEQLHTNKAGISDLRAGRKKISLELLNSMKKSYSEINIEWIITGEGEMLKGEKSKKKEAEPNQSYIIEIQAKLIDKLEEEVKELKKAREPENNYRRAAEPDQ